MSSQWQRASLTGPKVTELSMNQGGEKSIAAAAVQKRLAAHRSSLFELSSYPKAAPCGSSITSFAYEPHGDEHKPQNKVQYENTYKMDPDARYRPEKVNAIIKEVLEDHLDGLTYDPIECSYLAKVLAESIRNKVKELDFKRYKIVPVVTIFEKKDQGLRMGSRCLWNTEHDNFSSFSYENPYLGAVGVVYAVYYE